MVGNLRAVINWCGGNRYVNRGNRYVNGEIKIKLLKEDARPVKSLSNTQIKKLLSTSKPYKTLRMRILLALGSGLRLGDIETWRILYLEHSFLDLTNKVNTNVDPVLRHVVDQIPTGDWL